MLRLGSYGYSEDEEGVYAFPGVVLKPSHSGFAAISNIYAGPERGTATVVQGEKTWDCTYSLYDAGDSIELNFWCTDETSGSLDVKKYLPYEGNTYYGYYEVGDSYFEDMTGYEELDDTAAQLTFDNPGINTKDIEEGIGAEKAYIFQKDVPNLIEYGDISTETVGDETTFSFSNDDNEMTVVQTEDGGAYTTNSITITKGFTDFIIN